MSEKYVEETPQMAKVRKAKAALKGSQSHISEVVIASENMSTTMNKAANLLERYAKDVGAGVYLYGHCYGEKDRGPGASRLADLLLNLARELREKSV